MRFPERVNPDWIRPGRHDFGPDISRREIERTHNAALEAGLESEIVYYDTGIDLNIRQHGDKEPIFYADRLAATTPDLP